jgi:hypothetical protein
MVKKVGFSLLDVDGKIHRIEDPRFITSFFTGFNEAARAI